MLSEPERTYCEQWRDQIQVREGWLRDGDLSRVQKELIVDEIDALARAINEYEREYNDPDYDPFDWPF